MNAGEGGFGAKLSDNGRHAPVRQAATWVDIVASVRWDSDRTGEVMEYPRWRETRQSAFSVLMSDGCDAQHTYLAIWLQHGYVDRETDRYRTRNLHAQVAQLCSARLHHACSAVSSLAAWEPFFQLCMGSAFFPMVFSSPTLPQPPPPGVWMMMRSPAFMGALFLAPRLM